MMDREASAEFLEFKEDLDNLGIIYQESKPENVVCPQIIIGSEYDKRVWSIIDPFDYHDGKLEIALVYRDGIVEVLLSHATAQECVDFMAERGAI